MEVETSPNLPNPSHQVGPVPWSPPWHCFVPCYCRRMRGLWVWPINNAFRRWGLGGVGVGLCLLKVVTSPVEGDGSTQIFFWYFHPENWGGRWTNPFWRIIYFSKWVVENTKQLGFFGCFWGFGMGGTGVLNNNCFIFPQKTTSKRR